MASLEASWSLNWERLPLLERQARQGRHVLAYCPADLNLGKRSPPCLSFSAHLLPWEWQVIAITTICRGNSTHPHGS